VFPWRAAESNGTLKNRKPTVEIAGIRKELTLMTQRQQASNPNRIGWSADRQAYELDRVGRKRPLDDDFPRRLAAKLDWLDAIIPGNKIALESKTGAVWYLLRPNSDVINNALERFAAMTKLTPGTRAFYRAEFRNVIFEVAQIARWVWGGRSSPIYLALYEGFSLLGAGPDPDIDLPRKWREGLTERQHELRAHSYKSWFSQARNRIAMVREALDPESNLTARRRKSTLERDPLIAEWLSLDTPAQAGA